MIYKTSKFIREQDVSSVLINEDNDSLLPKIVIFNDGSHRFIHTTSEQTAYEASRDSNSEKEIIFPTKQINLVFGLDYPVLLLSNPDENLVFYEKLNPPSLNGNLTTDNQPLLSWDSAYLTATKVYRTEIYTIQAPADYILLAQVDGYDTFEGSSTFLDIISLEEGQSVNYFVENSNGMSNIVTLSRP